MPINPDKYNRSISLMCPTCGGTEFITDEKDEYSDDDTHIVKCSCCGYETTRAQLQEENSELIQAQVDEIGQEFAGDLKKELKSMFKGNKHIRFK
ncbi:ECs_2282 family putative zinc-binding protein [Vibrio quintilis]|uniref:ECs_2282 family putative zinc-binding protein n=1 Tax=Vibrio quintilis TaxID=1117707 RepID=UPI0021C89FAF|nr:hypothetical protein [Vibrio quintilis]